MTVADVSVWVHRELAPVVGTLMAETEKRGYHLHNGQCWGYACRAIRGKTAPSNHSWGLAVDFNAPSNPMASTLITDMPAWMPKLWADAGFRWGGTYSGRKDAMHYEFMGTPADARALAADFGHNPLPTRRAAADKERFMYDPALVLERIVASMPWKTGGSVLLAASGAVYAFDSDAFKGGANGKEYFKGRRAARLEPRTDGVEGYVIVATSGERYAFPE